MMRTATRNFLALQLVLVMLLSFCVAPATTLAEGCPHKNTDRSPIEMPEQIVDNDAVHELGFWMTTVCFDCGEVISDVKLFSQEEPHQFEADGSGWVCKWCKYQTSKNPANAATSKPTATPKPTATAKPKPTNTPKPTAAPKPTTSPKYFNTEKLADGTLSITGYTGNGGEVVIPAMINGRPVTAIGEEAFQDKNITSLVIPEGVTTIDELAFSFNWDMAHVTLPSTLKVIDNYAFNQCDLREVSLPEGLEVIGMNAFSNNEQLTKFHIQASVTYIDGGFLENNNKVKTFTIAKGNKAYKIVDGVLFSADSSTLVYYLLENTRTEYVVPEGVVEIAEGAFNCVGTLKQIALPKSLKTIGSAAFHDCYSLESITIPSCTNLGGYMFVGCVALKEIALPEGITSIRYATFSGCTNLETVILPLSVTSIDEFAFSVYDASYKPMQIHMSGNVTYIDDEAFKNREKVTIVCPYNSYAWKFAKNHHFIVQASAEVRNTVEIGKAAEESSRKQVYIVASNGTILSGPSMSSNLIYYGFQGDCFPLLGEEGTWYKVEVDGKTGYIRKYLCEVK